MSRTYPAPLRPARLQSRDFQVEPALDDGGELLGYRLYAPSGERRSRLYLSREDALDAWINRSIEWED